MLDLEIAFFLPLDGDHVETTGQVLSAASGKERLGCSQQPGLFGSGDGLATIGVITVAVDPMTFPHPHSHSGNFEEVWAAIKGTSLAFLGKQIRKQPPGTAYMIPPDGNTPHSNINTSDRQIKFLYFSARK